jgi:hypothetical protein
VKHLPNICRISGTHLPRFCSGRFCRPDHPDEARHGQSIVCRKETFLCAERSVGLEIAFQQRLGADVFAGEGFILQRVTGVGSGGHAATVTRTARHHVALRARPKGSS